MMRLGKRSTDDFHHFLDLNKRQTASMMRMGKRGFDTDTAESADRIYRSLMNKRQTASMMRMGKRLSAFYDDARFGKRGNSAFNTDMMRMGKRGSSSFNGDMMRMGKRNFDNDMRFGKRDE